MHRKRASTEPAEALLGEEAPLPANARRPKAIALGAALVLGRAIAAVLWLVTFTLVWPATAQELKLDHEESAVLYWIVAIVNVIITLVLLLFSWLIWRGSNFARVVTMFVLTFSILSSAVGHFAYGEAITVHTTLMTLALDILILLALSSRDARAWARRSRR